MPVSPRALLVRPIRETEFRPPLAALRRTLEAAYRRRRSASISLLLTDDARIAVLNRRWHGTEGPTDVLAFEGGAREPGGRLFLGDIAVSVETAKREAAARGWGTREELVLYAVHGLLHLLGGRDDDEAGRRRMQEDAVRAFRAAGLPWEGIRED